MHDSCEPDGFKGIDTPHLFKPRATPVADFYGNHYSTKICDSSCILLYPLVSSCILYPGWSRRILLLSKGDANAILIHLSEVVMVTSHLN